MLANGEKELNHLRDQAREISAELQLEKEFRILDKIIIPSVYRIDYIDALKRLTQNGEPATIIRAMERVRLFSSGLDGSDYDALKAYLEQCNAFRDELEFILRF